MDGRAGQRPPIERGRRVGLEFSMRGEFIALENQARIQGRGLWAPR